MTDEENRVARRAARKGSILTPIQQGWMWITGIWRDIRGVPFIIGLMAVIGLLMNSEQGADISAPSSDWNAQTGWAIASAFILGLQAWFWTRYIIDQDARRRTAKARSDSLLLLWLPRFLGAAPLLFLALAISKSNLDLGLAAYAAIGGAAFALMLRLRRPIIKSIQQKGEDGGLLSERSRSVITGIFQWVSLLLAAAALVLVTFDPVGPSQYVGPVGVVYLGFALIIPVIAAALHYTRAWKLPVIELLITLAMVWTLHNDNHEVGRRWNQPRFSASLDSRISLKSAFDLWKAQPRNRNFTGPIPIVFVAAEGGASRAGYWAAEVLGRLHEDSGGAFSDSVFSISSVSGGSVGATAFVSQLHDDPTPVGFRDAVRTASGADFLSPALAGLLFPDLVQRFLPKALLPDRAETLERGFEHGWATHCEGRPCNPALWSGAFLSIWKRSTPRWTPALMINGTREEDGARIITSNVRINPNDFPNTVDFLAVNGSDIRVSTAILNGARFPLVSPGGTIHQRQPKGAYPAEGHILDGGYYDGGGIATMRDTAQAVLGIAAAEGVPLRPIFLEINNDADAKPDYLSLRRTFYDAASTGRLGTSATHDFLPDILGPLEGLWKAGGARGTTGAVFLALDVNRQPTSCNASKSCVQSPQDVGVLQTPTQWGVEPAYIWLHLCNDDTLPGRTPMDWVLSAQAKEQSRHAAGDLAHKIAAGCGNAVEFNKLAKALSPTPATPLP